MKGFLEAVGVVLIIGAYAGFAALAVAWWTVLPTIGAMWLVGWL